MERFDNAAPSPPLFNAQHPISQVLETLASLPQASLFVWLPLQHPHFLPQNPQATEGLWVAVSSLHTMQHMGLGHLPLQSVSIPVPQEQNPAHVLPSPQWAVPLQGPLSSTQMNLGRLFPTWFVAALYELQSIFTKLQVKGYVIGGLARDLMLTEERKLSIGDVDLTLEAPADEVAKAIEAHSRNFTLVAVYPSFGTAKLRYKHHVMLDLASTRTEVYDHCGAMPRVLRRGVPLLEDVSRRDFTVNTLAFSIHNLGEVLDPLGASVHLQQQQIHVLHGATFFEDPSRLLRAYKFATRLQFEFSRATHWLAQQFETYVPHTPFKGGGARVREALEEWLLLPPTPHKHELLLHWLEEHGMQSLLVRPPQSGVASVSPLPLTEASPLPYRLLLKEKQGAVLAERLKRLRQQWPVLQERWGPMSAQWPQKAPWYEVFVPSADEEEEQETSGGSIKPQPLLWLATLAYMVQALELEPPCAAEFFRRLELTKVEAETVVQLSALLSTDPFYTLSQEASMLEVCEAFAAYNPLVLLVYWLAHPQATPWAGAVFKYLQTWRWLKPQLNGDDLLRLGVPRGEAVGQCLKRLRAGVLNRQLASRGDEEAFVLAWLQRYSA